MRIDAHQHFWAMARGDYSWLTPDLAPIYRDFLPADLAPLLAAQGIDGTILVQAAPTVAETEFMLGLAAQTPWIKGVVGWVGFADAAVSHRISQLARDPNLVGLRPMIQDIADTDWMLRDDLGVAFDTLKAHGLTFDALTLPRHLPNLLTLLARHADMRVVINHGSKPDIRNDHIADWTHDMTQLARNTACFCKLSGLVTEARPDWTVEDLRPVVDHLLAEFGPDRLIWGSDWPVCTLAASYDQWCDTSDALLADLSDLERAAVLGGTAARAYGLDAAV